MIDRRTFMSLIAGAAAAPNVAWAQPTAGKVALYANVGADLTNYNVDVAGAALIKRATVTLPAGAIHISTDIPSEFILVAFNNPSALRVYRINKDFTPGEEVKQPGPIDAGIFAHQVRVTPDNRLAILVTRGNEGTPAKAEDPGALKVFDFKNRVSTHAVPIAPNR